MALPELWNLKQTLPHVRCPGELKKVLDILVCSHCRIKVENLQIYKAIIKNTEQKT